MMRVRSLLVAIVLIGASPVAAHVDGTLLLANRADGSISLFDLAQRREVVRVPVTPAPHEVAVSPDGRWAIAAEFGSPDEAARDARRLHIIDVVAGVHGGYVDLGAPSRPHGVTFLPDSRHALVTVELQHAIALVDVHRRSVIRTYAIGEREGHMVAVSPDGSRAYVTARGPGDNTGTLSVVFLQEERPPVIIDTGDYSEGISVAPDGQEVWVANRYGHTLDIIDTRTLTRVAAVATEPYPTRIAFTSDGRVGVTSGLAARPGAGVFTLYDRASREPIYRHRLREYPAPAGGFGGILNLTIMGQSAIVSEHDTGRVVLFDLANLNEAPTVVFERHPFHPDGIAWSPLRIER